MRRFGLTIGLSVMLVLTGCHSVPESAQRDPYQPEWEMPGDSMVMPLLNQRDYQWQVRAVVNGQPGVFILDTGADHTLLTPEFARKAGLWDNSTEGRLLDQAGAPGKVRFALVLFLQLGEAVYSKFYAPIVNLDHINRAMNTPIDGILGNNVLNQTAWQIDGRRNVLTLMSRSPTRPQDSIPLAIRQNHIYVQAMLNGVATEFALDTGAYRTTVSAKELGRLRIPREKQTQVEAPTIDINGTQFLKQTDVEVDSFRLGPVSRTNYLLRVWDHNALGMDLLAPRVLTVDAREGWMSLAEPALLETH